MKKSFFVLVFVFYLSMKLAAQVEPVQPTKTEVNYPVKAATVEYAMSMMGTDNPMTIRFKDGGKTQSTDVKISMFGVTQHSRNIMVGNKMYELNMVEKTYKESELTEEQIKKNQASFFDEQFMEEEGATKGEKVQFLGKTCQIYEMSKEGADAKIWSWNGLVLKMESSAQGMMVTLEAKSIEEGTPDNMYFEIPSDFTKAN